MSKNGEGTPQELIQSMPETSATTKLTWQWQKKATLRNIENALAEVKEKLGHIHSDIECSRKEDRREIKLLQDDLIVARAKAGRLERTIDEMKKEKLQIIKIQEELLMKKDLELKETFKQFEETLNKKDDEIRTIRKESKLLELNLRHEHERELKARDNHLAALEAQNAKRIAGMFTEKEKLKSDYEHKLKDKDGEIANVKLTHMAEVEEMCHSKETAVQEMNDKVDDLLMKLNDCLVYLRNALQLIELKNNFILKQREGFKKIVDYIGESEPKPVKLKGNLWKLAHYIRTGGQAAWKGYINRAQWEAANEDADSILRVATRALADVKFETEDEPQFREALNQLFNQLQLQKS